MNDGPSRRVSRLGRRHYTCGLALLVAAALGLSCSGFVDVVRLRFGGKVWMDVVVDAELNRDFPVAVDLVIPYDKGLYEELKKIKAETWFESRDQYLKDFEKKVDSHYSEWVPGVHIEQLRLRYKLGARGGVVFAQYFTPGAHREVIEPLKGFRLLLGESEFTVEPRRGRRKAKKDKEKRRKLKLPPAPEG